MSRNVASAWHEHDRHSPPQQGWPTHSCMSAVSGARPVLVAADQTPRTSRSSQEIAPPRPRMPRPGNRRRVCIGHHGIQESACDHEVEPQHAGHRRGADAAPARAAVGLQRRAVIARTAASSRVQTFSHVANRLPASAHAVVSGPARRSSRGRCPAPPASPAPPARRSTASPPSPTSSTTSAPPADRTAVAQRGACQTMAANRATADQSGPRP